MKRINIWILIGLLFIITAFSITAFNIHRSNQMGQNSDRILEKLDIEEKTINGYFDPSKEMKVQLIDGIEYCGIIEIPDIQITLPVISTYSMEYLEYAPCLYYGNVYQDNMIICAHNADTHFNKIRTLSMNSEVRYKDMEGNTFVYEVTNIETLNPDAVEQLLADTDWDLTLFTCNGLGESRCVVRLNKVK